MKRASVFFVLLFTLFHQSSYLMAQCADCPNEKKKKGNWYFLWGYNRDWYLRSTIHFSNPDGDPSLKDQFGQYDFKIYNVTAHDRPQFDKIKDVINITVPQFNGRLGYYFNDSKDQGFEINYDHAKYVVDDWQTVRIKGSAFGQSFDKDTTLNPAYIHFEHSDGANFWSFNYLRRWNFFKSNDANYKFSYIVKPGIGLVYPRTDVTIFGHRLNNNWHISGVCADVETGLQAILWKHFTMELTGKAVGANYIKCLVQGKGHGRASHVMGCAEAIFTFGYTF